MNVHHKSRIPANWCNLVVIEMNSNYLHKQQPIFLCILSELSKLINDKDAATTSRRISRKSSASPPQKAKKSSFTVIRLSECSGSQISMKTSNSKRHLCIQCGKSFLRPCQLHDHMKKKHTGNSLVLPTVAKCRLKCTHCDKRYALEKALQNHEETHRKEADMLSERTCHVCGKLVNCRRYLKLHMLTHTGEKSFMCGYCGQRFSTARGMRCHELTHTGEKPFACTNCGRRFTQLTELRYHEVSHHDNPKMYMCSECGRQFKHRRLLNHHMLVHSDGGERPFRCHICDAAYRTKGKLTVHSFLHTGERPHSCTDCPKKFRFWTGLQKHLLLHKGKRPYRCEICDKTFVQAGNMKTHMRTHTGEKPYACSACGVKFSHSGSLQKHLLTHSAKEDSYN